MPSRKALKEGRKPDPGPPADDDDVSAPSSTSYDLGPNETSATTPPSESIHYLSYLMVSTANILQACHLRHILTTRPTTNILRTMSHRLVLTPMLVTLAMISIHLLLQVVTLPRKLPRIHIPTFSTIQVFRKAVFHWHLLTIRPIIKVLILLMHSSHLHQLQVILQLLNNHQVVGSGTFQTMFQLSETYHYDSNYQPPPEKIAEAQKAARFVVSALGFNEVPVAVEHLKKSLELLTKPSAGH